MEKDIRAAVAPEIGLVQADSSLFGNSRFDWLLTRKQIVYVLRTIMPAAAAGVNGTFAEALYLDRMLPVINLEHYFGLQPVLNQQSSNSIVIRSVAADGKQVMAVVQFAYPIRMRKVSFETQAMPAPALLQNTDDLLGVFAWSASNVILVPDFAAIIAKHKKRV